MASIPTQKKRRNGCLAQRERSRGGTSIKGDVKRTKESFSACAARSCCENFPKRRNLHLNAGRERRDGGKGPRERVIKLDQRKLRQHVDRAAALLISPMQHLFGDLARCALTPCPTQWRGGPHALTCVRQTRVRKSLASQSASLPPSLPALSVKSVFLTRPSSASPFFPPPPSSMQSQLQIIRHVAPTSTDFET